MSTFDLNRIVESLQSSKIKSRNDALNLLAGLSASKLRLHSRQFTVLVSGLLRLIEIEKQIFANNFSNPVVSRLSIASSFLRDLVEEELKNSHKKPRYKHCITIVHSIASSYFVDVNNLPLEPCALSFSQIVLKFLLEEFFQTHLTVEAWLKTYKFLTKAIDTGLDEGDNVLSASETILYNHFQSILLLIGGNTTLVYLPIYQDRAYFPLLSLIKRCLRTYDRRESPVLIACFKLINKLVIVLSTEDIRFCNELIRHALKSILQFSSTSVEALFIQFSIFINLDPVYRYYNILNIPQITGGDDRIFDADRNLANSFKEKEEEIDIQLYTLGALIQELIKRTCALLGKLTSSEVSICENNRDSGWFKLPNIQFTSGNVSLWLLPCGLTKLINLYYKLRPELTASFQERLHQSNRNLGSSFASTNSLSNKRQKLKDQRTKLWTSDTSVLFYMSLASTTEDNKMQLCGVQLLAFHCELFETCRELIKSTAQSTELELSATWNFNDSTLLDLNLVSFDDSSSNLLPALNYMVKLLCESRMTFWVLICCRSLLAKMCIKICQNNQIITKRVHQLLKLLIPYIKDKEYCSVATSIFVHILLQQSDSEIHILVDDTLKAQLINIADLADLAGPAKIDVHALRFWWCLARLFKGKLKNGDIAISVSRWFASKWSDELIYIDAGVKRYSRKLMPQPEVVRQILCWISGENISSSNLDNLENPSHFKEISDINHEMNQHIKLQYFIADRNLISEIPIVSDPICKCVPILASAVAAESICFHIREVTALVINSEDNFESIACWAVSLSKMLDGIFNETSLSVDCLLNCVQEIWQVVSDSIKTLEHASFVISSILNSQLSKEIMIKTLFPFESVIFCFQDFQRKDRLLHERITEDSDFEDFSSSGGEYFAKSHHTAFETLVSYLIAEEWQNFFKFNVIYERNSMEDQVRQLELLSTPVALPCLLFYVRYLKSVDAKLLTKDSLIRVVRVVGEGPLSDQSLDRADVTILTCCDLLRFLLPICERHEMRDLKNDSIDLFIYLAQCMLKGLFLTESKISNFWKLFLYLSSLNVDPLMLTQDLLTATFLEDFEEFPYRIKIDISGSLAQFLSQLIQTNRMNLYREILLRFTNPQSSVERCAAYCLFFTLVTRYNHELRMAALFNLIECTKFEFFKPYLIGSIEIISRISGNVTPKQLFLSSKLELLKLWWTYNHDIFEFPHDLFGYKDRNSYLSENYRELVAVLIATKRDSKTCALNIVEKIAKWKRSDVQSLVCDSLPIIVPLAYSSEGVRNLVFKILSESLGDCYKTFMRQKLSLTILETIRFTDFKSEKGFINLLSFSPHIEIFFSDVLIETSLQTIISPNSSVELINALISKYWILEKEQYWTHRNVYFFIKQLGRGCIEKKGVSLLLFLRATKFVFCMSNLPLNDFELFRLVVEVYTSLDTLSLDRDIYAVLQLFDKQCLLEMPVQKSTPTVFKLLCKICQHSYLPEKTNFVEDLNNRYNEYEDKFGTLSPIIRAALNCSQNLTVDVKYDHFGKFLVDSTFSSLIDNNFIVIVSLFSCLLQYAIKSEVASPEDKLIKLVLSQDVSVANDDVKLWISLCLSQFYLSGSIENNINAIIGNNEFYTVQKDELFRHIGQMDFFLELIEQDLESHNYEELAFAETILGSLLWKYESRKGDVQKFMNFEKYYSHLKTYLIPLDFHTCVLINSSDNSLDITSMSLDSFILKFSSILSDYSFEDWTSQLILSVIQEVASYTSLASLLASYVLKFPAKSVIILPKLICFFVTLTGVEGAKKIGNLFTIFWKSFKKPYDFRAIEMIKDTVLLVRIGAKLGLEVFKEFYAFLNKSELFMIIKEGSFPKSALMIFEDSINGKLESIDWNFQTSTLTSIYESLDDEDLLQGLPEDPSVVHALKLISQFGTSAEKVHFSSGELDASLMLNGRSEKRQFILSLLEDGLLGASRALGSTSEQDSSDYEWAWKLNLWELPLPGNKHNKNEVIYSYFKRIYESPSTVYEVFKDSTLEVMEMYKDAIAKGKTAKDSRFDVKLLLETVSILEALSSILIHRDLNFNDEVCKFNELTLWFKNADLEYFEDILRARQTAFKILDDKIMSSSISEQDLIKSSASVSHDFSLQGFSNELMRAIEMYRINSQAQKMISSTVLLDNFVQSSDFSDDDVREGLLRLSKYQFAKTLWYNGKTTISVAMLEELGQRGSIDLPLTCLNVDKALISATLAEWLAESRQSLGSTILTLIIDPMKDSIGQINNHRQRAEVFHLLGHFCEQQYKSRNLSEQLQDLKKRVKSKRNEIDEIKSHYGRTSVSSAEKKSVQKYYNRLKSQLVSEDSELNSLKSKRELFAENAVRFYLFSLLVGDEYSADMDNFFSLFLELANNGDLQRSIQKDLEMLPSFKPLSWCTQLLSRISSDNSHFQQSIQNLVLRICQDHPYHSLYYLISLIKHEDIAKDTSNELMLARVDAAKKLKDRLATISFDYNSSVLLPIEQLSDQSIILSEYKSSKGRKLDLEKLKVGFYWMNELPNIPPPTFEIPVSYSGYSQIPRMISIVPKVSIATSGLSLPKIATFLLSDGTQHKMLLKHGTDDLRQDATMEQVFNKVNNIFEKDRETRKRHLRVRTYKAVPLGPKAGVIEFVLNSKALIEVIRPYHQKLDSLKSETARQTMKDCQTDDLKERIRVYNNITSKIHPVLRHYFTDNFVSPDAWFQSRQIYTRGIAASSMVGHILGLGDRHCNNILLDEFTGEPIHIDLGVAFDQGKRLPIPETVPFRLTRDIVDGFGFTGTRGSFSKLCEHSFRVLRSNKERILSILDVLRWDPLYSWSISPIRKKKLQDENGAFQGINPHEDGSEAGAALLTVVEKLNAGGLSVEATVRELIQEATSVENLAVIYCGWCPFF